MKRELRIGTILAVMAGVATYAAANRRATLAQSGDGPAALQPAAVVRYGTMRGSNRRG